MDIDSYQNDSFENFNIFTYFYFQVPNRPLRVRDHYQLK